NERTGGYAFAKHLAVVVDGKAACCSGVRIRRRQQHLRGVLSRRIYGDEEERRRDRRGRAQRGRSESKDAHAGLQCLMEDARRCARGGASSNWSRRVKKSGDERLETGGDSVQTGCQFAGC